MMRLKDLRQQGGETIVEVLVALTALGIVIAACAVIVNRSTQSMQTTGERSAALGIAQGQVERVKEYIAVNPSAVTALGTEFCMSQNSAENTVQTGGACIDTETAQRYRVANRLAPTANGSYTLTVNVTFDTLSGSESSVRMTYRMYP